MVRIDPHSYAEAGHPLTKSIDLKLAIDFSSRSIHGSARLVLEREAEGKLTLDTRDLKIKTAKDGKSGKEVPFSLDPEDPILGSCLNLSLTSNEVILEFETGKGATALQWLEGEQTAGGKLPYLFSQCQPIHARSIFPCQDTPIARIRYTAQVEIPSELSAVMSAKHMGREVKGGQGGKTAVETFVMEQPIPPYLFAIAVGDITSIPIGPRTRVYAEPSVVKAAAFEFAETPRMMEVAEGLFGAYDWEEFNVLVMPPSFPYGGMENPRMTFLTPSLITGDRALVNVVAHELAHSWTGNLVSSANYKDFWLNEGWTVYAERRILEAVEGADRAEVHAAVGWNGLQEDLKRFEAEEGGMRFTQLDLGNLTGVDPDLIFSRVPYEKGYLFLRRIESAVGRAAFDIFVAKYISAFRFQSISTHTFLDFLHTHLPQASAAVDVHAWVHLPGVPPDAPFPKSEAVSAVAHLASEFAAGTRKVSPPDAARWRSDEFQIFLDALPPSLPHAMLSELDKSFAFSTSKNSELRIAFLTITASSGSDEYLDAIWNSLHAIGRMKYLRPLYKALVDGNLKDHAKKCFESASPKYHPVARAVIKGVLVSGGVL